MRQDLALIAIGIGSTLLVLAFIGLIRWLVSKWKATRAPALRLVLVETKVKELDTRISRAEKHLQTIEPDWDDSKALTELLRESKGLQPGFELVPRKGSPNR
jgi:hypothetical protein